MRIDVHVHYDMKEFQEVKHLLHQILNKEIQMATAFDDLTREVSETRTVVDSAVALLRGLKERLDQAGTDPQKLQELSASLDSKQQELAQAIVDNTPAE